MSESFACIVIGTGAVGSAVLHELAQRGVRALGLDRFAPGHARGSSHGRTRLIRLAYAEHPDYVPLLRRAFELWEALDADEGEQLYVESGLIEAGPPDCELVTGVLRSASLHGVPVERLDQAALRERVPGLRLPDDSCLLFEPRAGHLHVEACVHRWVRRATRLGAVLRTDGAVRRMQRDGGGWRIDTDTESYRGDCIIITPGPWAVELLADVGVRFEVLRKPQLWYQPHDDRYGASAGFPAFIIEEPSGRSVYGFPVVDARGVKVGEHTGGEPVSDPLALDGALHDQDHVFLDDFVGRVFPGLIPRCSDHEVCMYTMSPDGHFVVDRHPEHANVFFAAGLSGHGFKFAPVLGEALAQMALEGAPALPLGFLGLQRFAQSCPR